MVSVIMPAYNAEKFIGETIQSVINQTFDDWELVIVIDGAKDNTAGVVNEYKEKYPSKIRVINRTDNKGTAYTLNEAMKNATGEYMCWLSADDLYNPDMIKSSLSHLKEYGTDFVFSRCDYIDENSQYLKSDNRKTFWEKDIQLPESPYFELMTTGCPLHGCTVFGYRKAFVEIGGFDASYRYAHDYDYWLRLFSKHSIRGFNEVNVRGREYPTQISKQGNNAADAIKVFFDFAERTDDFEALSKKAGFGSAYEGLIQGINDRIRLYATKDYELDSIKELLDSPKAIGLTDGDVNHFLRMISFFQSGCAGIDASFFDETSEHSYLKKIISAIKADAIVINSKAVRFDRYADEPTRNRFVHGLERDNELFVAEFNAEQYKKIIQRHDNAVVQYRSVSQDAEKIKVAVTRFMVNDDDEYSDIDAHDFAGTGVTIWDALIKSIL